MAWSIFSQGFERAGVPFLDLPVLTVVVEVHLAALARERQDAGDAELRGVAHDVVHHGAFGQRLRERDGAGQGSALARGAHGERGGLFAVARQFALPLGAVAVEGDHRIAEPRSIHDDEMVRLLAGEDDLGAPGGGRLAEDAEVGHGRVSAELSERRL